MVAELNPTILVPAKLASRNGPRWEAPPNDQVAHRLLIQYVLLLLKIHGHTSPTSPTSPYSDIYSHTQIYIYKQIAILCKHNLFPGQLRRNSNSALFFSRRLIHTHTLSLSHTCPSHPTLKMCMGATCPDCCKPPTHTLLYPSLSFLSLSLSGVFLFYLPPFNVQFVVVEYVYLY